MLSNHESPMVYSTYHLNRISHNYLSSCMNYVLAILREESIDIDKVAQEARLVKANDGFKTRFVTWKDYKNLLSYLDESGLIPGIGLLVGDRIQLGDFGVLGYASLSAETYGKSIQLGASHADLLGWGLGIRFQADNTSMSEVRIFPNARELLPKAIYEQWAKLCLGGAVRNLGNCQNCDLNDFTFYFPFSRPVYTDLYSRSFKGCKLLFDMGYCGWRYPSHWNDVKLPSHDSAISAFCINELSQLSTQKVPDPRVLIEEVNAYIALNSYDSVPDMQSAAVNLKMSPATLRRKLAAAGETYQELVDRFRMAKAEHLVSETHLKFKEIAYRLGYRHPSSFYIAFKQWFNCTPKEYRENAFR